MSSEQQLQSDGESKVQDGNSPGMSPQALEQQGDELTTHNEADDQQQEVLQYSEEEQQETDSVEPKPSPDQNEGASSASNSNVNFYGVYVG